MLRSVHGDAADHAGALVGLAVEAVLAGCGQGGECRGCGRAVSHRSVSSSRQCKYRASALESRALLGVSSSTSHTHNASTAQPMGATAQRSGSPVSSLTEKDSPGAFR